MPTIEAVRIHASKIAAAGLLLAVAGCQPAGQGSSEPHAAVLAAYCADCHNDAERAGGLAFERLDLDDVGAHQEIWEKAVGKLRGGLMPPAGASQPERQEVDGLIAYLEQAIDSSVTQHRIGHVPVQRLNRDEFATTIEGLIGVRVDPEQILPREIEVEGFNNVAGALGASPAFLEQYVSAVRAAATKAVGEPVPKLASVLYPIEPACSGRGNIVCTINHRDGFPLGTRGGTRFTHTFLADGEYRFNILGLGEGLYPRPMETAATLVLLIDGVEVARREVGGPEDLELADRDGPEGRAAIVAKVTGIPAQVAAGPHEIVATFIERSWALSNDANGGGRHSGMPQVATGIEVVGPIDPAPPSMSESRRRIFVCRPETTADERACAERIASQLATRAFRRPVTDADLGYLMPFYEAGRAEEGGFEAGVLELVVATLSSPDFLYRAIRSAPAPALAPALASAPDATRALDDLELVSRLSFFLWSAGPDDELLELAIEGQLSKPGVMERQVERMLADDRAQAMIENFALAWLNVDELEQVVPTEGGFDVAMRENFETEIRLFLSSVLLEGRSVNDLLTADHTFLNEALARHYGIDGVYGPQFRRITFADENRFGLLGKGAVLLRTSYGDRTSPVLRGAWVLERILGATPPQPPPEVVTDLSVKEGEPPTTVRQRLEKHREDPTCNGCHGLIDPAGLALENFDVTGRWRTVDTQARAPIDARTVLASGDEIEGPVELRRHLTSREDQFPTTVTKRLMMYALNRELEYYDMPQVRAIVRAAAKQNYTLEAIVKGIVDSDAFRRQGADEAAAESGASVASIDAPSAVNR